MYDKLQLNLLREIVLTQFKLKDQTTALGLLWSLLNPLMLLGVLFAVFSLRMAESIDRFGVYLLIGIVHYVHFSNSTTASMHVLLDMRELTRETIFPKELLVVGTVLSRTVDFVLSLAVCLLIAEFAGGGISWTAPATILVVILQTMLVLWVSLWLSFLFLYLRDVDHIYQMLLRILFFVTPIFYDTDFLGPTAQTIVRWNPLAHLVGFSRMLVMDGSFPPLTTLGTYLVVNAVLIALSLRVFRRLEPTFAENM